LRVLHLTDRLSDRGGAHRHLLGVVGALREAGHEVSLAAGADEGHAEAPCPFRLVPGLESRTRVAVALDELADELAPDLVHVHTVVNPEVLAWAADRPAVMTVQDHRYFCPMRGKWTAAGSPCREAMASDTCAPCFSDAGYFEEIYALTAQRLDAIRRLRLVVLSEYMKRELAAVGVPAARIRVVPPFVHGLDPDAAPDGPPCVLFVGRLTEAKGARDALHAWRLSGVGLPLVAAGTGPLRAELEAAGVDVLGWRDPVRLSAAYRRARAVILPSRWQEPFGIAGLEALAMGVPVVAWESGGVGEWHPGPRAAWGDVPALARALTQAVGQTAAVPTGFDREDVMRRLMAVYEEAVVPHRVALAAP
jgi:glycosyltransferase involved in cell wall biosynthesis